MSNATRNTSGKFAFKSETPRKIRSVNLTDGAWQWLASVAEQAGMSRNDYLEALASGSPLMETVQPLCSPLMETVGTEVGTDGAKTAQQPDTGVVPLIETVQDELESLAQKLEDARADYAALLESSTNIADKLRQQVQDLRSQLDAKPAALSEKSTPDAASILSQLRTQRKKSKADLVDVEAILEILEN